ncbi:ATP-dependent DNA helicase PIF1-like [Uloborus diversus]|uniref:ATP-dependent DNA helicase PIF1-like n=1 Tax=Uloborus diversus TaxID=327109 RepID=UPI0024096783|nr:ATP-dependent DNA helicase PIF1-like [Uloborus diversus]
MSQEDLSLSCSVKVNYLDGKGCVNRSLNNARSLIQLGRNEFREIILKIECGKITLSFGIKDMILHTRFIKEGKATITLKEPNVHILISNCPTGKLNAFLKTLVAKVERLKESKPIGVKERLLSTKPRSFEEISPLTALDVNILQKRLNKPVSKQSNWPETPKSRKRGAQDSGPENSTPLRKIPNIDRPLVSRLLTAEQRNVMNAVMSGRNIFFTGSAGTGKSFLLKRILGTLAPDSTFATASTGVAACQIGGITLHAFAGIGSGTAPLPQCLEQAIKKCKSWKQCQHLIVDEISMVDRQFFQKLEKIARVVRKNDKPFGGIQLILTGDFLQLPPVCKKGQDRTYCFQSEAWRNCIDVNIELKQVKRQNDKDFINLLQDVRRGRSSKEVVAKLKSTSMQNIDKDGILATKLSTHKDDVEIINTSHLAKLPGESQVFYATDNTPSLIEFMNNHCPVSDKLELKVGAQVMLTKNLDLSRGLVNGARGVVVAFEKETQKLPIVKFVCGVQEAVQYEKWTVRAHSGLILVRKMLPLKLAWAMSIHKSQGMTLDCVEVSLSRVFECGQAYVALSRARSMKGLRVLDIEPSSIRADPQVLKFYHRLQCITPLFQSEIEEFLS